MMAGEEGDDGYDYGSLAWCLLTWLMMELLFLGIILVYLVPRMNRLEPPAQVSPCVRRRCMCCSGLRTRSCVVGNRFS